METIYFSSIWKGRRCEGGVAVFGSGCSLMLQPPCDQPNPLLRSPSLPHLSRRAANGHGKKVWEQNVWNIQQTHNNRKHTVFFFRHETSWLSREGGRDGGVDQCALFVRGTVHCRSLALAARNSSAVRSSFS